jgi:hypothetical protein
MEGREESLFPRPEAGLRRALEEIPPLIDRVFPLPKRFRAALPKDVAELSRLFTTRRGERQEGYLGRPALLSAYLRYFLPWNLYRLSRLISALPLALVPGDAVTDLGSGPLTLPLALWLSRPDLREQELEFRCVDRTGAAPEAGKQLFFALAGKTSPWRIKIIRAPLGAPVRGKRAALVTAVNVCGEIIGGIPHVNTGALLQKAEKTADLLRSLAGEDGSILVAEPGVPRSGEFISTLRAALISRSYPPRSPCPHAGPCPLRGLRPSGGKAPAARTQEQGAAPRKWCHFAFDTGDAPAELRRLSMAAGIPKERVTLSFLLAGPAEAAPAGRDEGTDPTDPPADFLAVRIISDAFPLPGSGGRPGPGGSAGQAGRYGCSRKGLVLAAGKRAVLEDLPPGTLLRVIPPVQEKRDPKSGALLAELRG